MKKLLIIAALVLSGCVVYTPYMTGDCVDRAVQLKQYLQDKGYESRIVLGIRDGSKREGHAWVEYRKSPNDKWVRADNY